ncbi:hypothetical protein EDC94DRAFT_515275, partial [Helicostylum pulchrum]
ERHEQTQQDTELNQKGFKSNILGSFMIVYMAIISVFWMNILLVICLDYYGHVSYVLILIEEEKNYTNHTFLN